MAEAYNGIRGIGYYILGRRRNEERKEEEVGKISQQTPPVHELGLVGVYCSSSYSLGLFSGTTGRNAAELAGLSW
jgi:hypothetical protein